MSHGHMNVWLQIITTLLSGAGQLTARVTTCGSRATGWRTPASTGSWSPSTATGWTRPGAAGEP